MKDMILKGLNPQQKFAVEYLDSPLFVSAGAGSRAMMVSALKLKLKNWMNYFAGLWKKYGEKYAYYQSTPEDGV
jgi:hypothetical protein